MCVLSYTVDLKQIDFQVFLQQGWVRLGSAETCSLGYGSMSGCMHVTRWQGEKKPFLEGEKEIWRTVINKNPGLFIG